jgi:transposase-like protein
MKFAFKTIHEFHNYFKDEATCYAWFEDLRWDGKPVCPHCGNTKFYKVAPRGKLKDIPSYRCADRACGLPFTVRTKSVFEGSRIEFKKWLHAAYEITICKKGISSVELAARIGTSQKTAWFLNHRLRAMLRETEPTLLRDVVAFDETAIGGKETNKHADKKTPGSHGFKNKTMVIGARSYTGSLEAR